jgi:hypothetical protein
MCYCRLWLFGSSHFAVTIKDVMEGKMQEVFAFQFSAFSVGFEALLTIFVVFKASDVLMFCEWLLLLGVACLRWGFIAVSSLQSS